MKFLFSYGDFHAIGLFPISRLFHSPRFLNSVGWVFDFVTKPSVLVFFYYNTSKPKNHKLRVFERIKNQLTTINSGYFEDLKEHRVLMCGFIGDCLTFSERWRTVVIYQKWFFDFLRTTVTSLVNHLNRIGRCS